MKARALREHQVELRQLIESLSEALAADADLLSHSERVELEAAMSAGRQVCGGDHLDAIKNALDGLGRLSGPFAERRMNRAVSQALKGKSIQTF
ncbi:MAG: hypothetical protein EB068_06395 [Betaproteobacteria bacterium]|nr:hypothetical protein [Betaproteobacteria bacterium]